MKRESAALDAVARGFLFDPVVIKKLSNKKKQLLIGSVYDRFVAYPLLDFEVLRLGQENLKRDVFLKHILIAHSSSKLSFTPEITRGEAVSFAETIRDSVLENISSFSGFAERHSNDPGVSQNSGSLGWLQWGVTPMPFQRAVWSLGLGGLSDVIETDYGFHLVVVDSLRSSEFSVYDSDSYDYAAFRSSIVSVRDLLKDASFAYDREVLDERVVFYSSEVRLFFDLIESEREALSSSGQKLNLFRFISSLDSRFVVCRVDGQDFGLRWFLSSLSKIPNSRVPAFDSIESLIDFLKILIMQKIAVVDGEKMGLSARMFFQKRLAVEQSKLLYDVLLKDLVNSVSPPDSSTILNYYNNNADEKYHDPERVLVRQVKVESKSLADSLFGVLSRAPESFESLASAFSLNRKGVGGLMEPFERGKYNYLGEAAFSLEIGEVFGPIENLDRSFSVILLEDRLPGGSVPLERVYKRIESLLLKEYQEQIKIETFGGYINNPNLMVGEKYEKYFN